MPQKTEIKSVFESKNIGDNISINGWVKTFRSNRFIALNDGSCLEDIQCVINFEEFDKEILSKISQDQWETMSNNCYNWYQKNVHSKNSFANFLTNILYN